MDDVQKFVSKNQHQFGYVMQVVSEQWKRKDPIGALTVGPCNYYIEKHGDYHTVLDKLQSNEDLITCVKTLREIRLICDYILKQKLGMSNDDIEKMLKGKV